VGFLRRLLGGGGGGAEDGTSPAPVEDDRHAVAAWIRLGDPRFENEREQARLFALEDTLMRAMDASGVGEHDTNDLEPGYLAIRFLGPDADAMVAVLRPLLAGVPVGSYLAVRHGPPGTGEEREDLEGPA
jgi:hypothetical protein